MASQDQFQRFIFEHSEIRGAWVQLSDSFREAASQAPYPPTVRQLLGESLVASVLMSSTLKFSGSLSIQAQGQGPLSTLMAEFERLNSRLDSAKAVHNRLLASIDSLDITKNTHQETISILQQATRAYPLPIAKTKQILFGGLAGLLVGAALPAHIVTTASTVRGLINMTALAAVEGLGREAPGRLILLVGGQGKDADFTALAEPVRTLCKAVLAYGEDQAALANALGEATHKVSTLEEALQQASELAEAGDTILLSPACASFDQFRNFEHRGDAFRTWVEGRV